MNRAAITAAGSPLLLTVGRINLDMYVDALGVPMADATSFRASVGGSPTNIAIVAQRLGLPSAVLSAIGDDFAGDLVLTQLARFGVDTRWVQRSSEGATSLALLATLAPDTGQRQFYRHDPADAHLDPTLVESLPWESLKLVVLSADALAGGTTPQMITTLAERAARHAVPVWWDLDLRPSSWIDPDHYADAVGPALAGATGVIGTSEEFAALHRLAADRPAAIRNAVQHSRCAETVLKLGAHGAVWWHDGQEIHAPAATSKPVCTVGGGDATAGALIVGLLAGLSRADALRLAMRVAAHTVQQPFCSTGFPAPSDLGIEPLFRPASITGAP